jgi:hypothetical protein
LSIAEARGRRAVRLGVAGAVLAFLALTSVQAVAVRPYLPPDELYHVGYAAWVLEGRLPTLTTPLPGERVPLMPADGRPRRVYVANHPPLFHALAAVPVGLGERLGAPRAGFLAARLLSAALAARRLRRAPRRPDWPAAAAWAPVLAWPLALFAMVASYDGGGGHTHPRYLFPGLAVLAVVAALGLDALPGARLGGWIALVVLG